jgi:fructose-bisphosphate aldolase class I
VTPYDLDEIARALVAPGKGILAADETVRTIGERFQSLAIVSTPETRRAYRELLITAPGLSTYVSGMILYDETIRQSDAHGEPLVHLLCRAGILPGIKVDIGATALAGCPGEKVTEGLDGLRERLREYRIMGARFAKWRALFSVTERQPTDACIEVNASALGRYAALSQEQGLLPIVEPEVLMNGAHTLARTDEVTGRVLERVFAALRLQRVQLDAMLLKPNMVVPGKDSRERVSPAAVAAATLRVLRRHVPTNVPGIVFLSGGQDTRRATAHLNAMHVTGETLPWPVSFSFGRALQSPALVAWCGRPSMVTTAQQALLHRCRCNSAAAQGAYEPHMDEPEAERVTPSL